jgi:hypothetical protein
VTGTQERKNNDSLRATGLAGLNGKNNEKTKLHAYHIATTHRAYTCPETGHSADLLHSVSQTKKSSSNTETLTIMHLCGKKWCVNGAHLFVGRKKYNDQQTACHHGLQSQTSQDDIAKIQELYCKHSTKCWTIVYKVEYSEVEAHEWE